MKLLSKLFFAVFIILYGNSYAELFFPLSKLQPKAENKTEEREVEIPSLLLEGIVHSKEKIAVINGLYLKRGDSIQGCKVLNIERNFVELKCNSLPIKLTIDLVNSQKEVKDEKK